VNNAALSLYEDRERNLWVGTNGGGLHRFRDGSITTYALQEGLSADVAVSVYKTGAAICGFARSTD